MPNEHRDVERYTCPRELLPVVEAAFAAEGYTVEAPLERAVGGNRITVMTRGGSVISLHEDRARDTAEINVYYNGDADQPAVLGELPRLAAPHSRAGSRATRREG